MVHLDQFGNVVLDKLNSLLGPAPGGRPRAVTPEEQKQVDQDPVEIDILRVWVEHLWVAEFLVGGFEFHNTASVACRTVSAFRSASPMDPSARVAAAISNRSVSFSVTTIR